MFKGTGHTLAVVPTKTFSVLNLFFIYENFICRVANLILECKLNEAQNTDGDNAKVPNVNDILTNC